MNKYVVLLILLTILSVSTLVQAVVSDKNTGMFIAATSISHLALFVTGYFYYKSKADRTLRDLRRDILGK